MASFISRTNALRALLIALWCTPIPYALAQEIPPDEFVVQTTKGQLRLDGVISAINAARVTFTFDASSISYPNGRPHELGTPLSVTVTTSRDTYFHVRGSTVSNVTLADVKVGDSAVILSVFSTGDQKWSADEVAVWSKVEEGRYVLEGTHPPCPVPDGLVAWWRWKDSAADTSGKFVGSQRNGVAYYRGYVGKALRFDGKDDFVTVPDDAAFTLPHSLSIEGWVYFAPPLINQFGIIICRGGTSGLSSYALVAMDDGTVNFNVRNVDSVHKSSILNAPLPALKWVHVAGTLDDATGRMRLYINGNVAAEAVTDVRLGNQTVGEEGTAIGIGNLPAKDTPRYFRGYIDELSIYNRALMAAEVQGIYKAGSSGKIVSPLPPQTPAAPAP